MFCEDLVGIEPVEFAQASTTVGETLREQAAATAAVAALDRWRCTTDRIQMTATTGASEVWQARIDHELAAQLRADSAVLGLRGRTDMVRAALALLHQQAAEERMALSVDEFYRGEPVPMPIGVRAADRRLTVPAAGDAAP